MTPTPLDRSASEGELIRRALGPQWDEIHPDIQARFARNPPPDRRLYYAGTLSELACSRIGGLLARLTRPLVGGALIAAVDRDVPVDIEVFSRPGDPAIFKRRVYRLNSGENIVFTSRMVAGGPGELVEYVSQRLGMTLRLSAVNGELHFASGTYFFQFAGRRIPIPRLFTPGDTWLVHRNAGHDCFNIRIEIRHPLLGLTFLQVGAFHEVEEALPSLAQAEA
jgi:hypothetical protein